jgi:glucose/arabinose dehydrogenase
MVASMHRRTRGWTSSSSSSRHWFLLAMLLVVSWLGSNNNNCCCFCRAVPSGFIDEGVVARVAITGAFAPNPRNNNKPMLLLSSKEGQISVLEDPDNSDRNFQLADLKSLLCTNGERGLQTILPHPNFAQNRFIFMYYTANVRNCQDDYQTGPPNHLSRFTMDASTLQIDVKSEKVLLETPPAPKHMHNGGAMAFGNDGLLYVTTGDAGSRDPRFSQDLRNLYGKVLRLNVNGDSLIPNGNPFVSKGGGGVSCAQSGGRPPSGSADTAVCGEIFARGLRNPFRIAMDVNTKNKVRFVIGDVGASTWEEISEGGTDFAGTNYGWPTMEGPCNTGTIRDCPVPGKGVTDPFYYYMHTKSEEGGAVVGGAFVPAGLWPSEYKYLFIDYVFNKVYNLVEDKGRECRTCSPPRPGYRNETFHEHKTMVDLFFGPYKGGQALYIVSRSSGQNVRRIRYTASSNRAPVADIKPSKTRVGVNEKITFDGSDSMDPDGDGLTFLWDFGDGTTSTEKSPIKSFAKLGEFTVGLTVTDTKKQTNEVSVLITVGTPPTASIQSPPANSEFSVGQVFRLKGTATDSKGRVLDKSQLFWEVRQHHGEHFHPFLDRTAGNDFDLFPAPEPEDFNAATNSYLEIIMYAVDSDGVTTTVSRNIQPKKVTIEVDSVPSGLKIFLDEFPVTTPAKITSWVNHNLRLNVQDQGSNTFASWSTGGARKSIFKVPAASSVNPKLVATFRGSTPVVPTATMPPVRLLQPTPAPLASPTAKIPLNRNVRDCTTSNQCGRCEGNCATDDECQGDLVCFQKDAGVPGVDSVPGCIGSDLSKTDWCTLPVKSPVRAPTPISIPTPTPPTTSGIIPLNRTVRTCTSRDPCGRCEGHCQSDDGCAGSLVCFQKDAGVAGVDSVPGCLGVDFSKTDWCIPPPKVPIAIPTPVARPTPTNPVPRPTTTVAKIPLNRNVRDCSTSNQCGRCEGNCEDDNECLGDLICFKKDAGQAGVDSVPGCIGTDLSKTDWCTVASDVKPPPVPVRVSAPVAKPSAPANPIPLVRTVRMCTTNRPCQRCEGHCQDDDGCAGSLVCFRKTGGANSVPGCVGSDLSRTDWCILP